VYAAPPEAIALTKCDSFEKRWKSKYLKVAKYLKAYFMFLLLTCKKCLHITKQGQILTFRVCPHKIYLNITSVFCGYTKLETVSFFILLENL